MTDDDQPPTPAVNITAASGAIEGQDATFTLTANPAPTSAIQVKVDVTETGDFGVSAGQKTVTTGTGGTGTLTLPTTGDNVDEPNGSDMQDPNYGGEDHDLKRVLKTLGVAGYSDYNGNTVGVQEATNRELCHATIRIGKGLPRLSSTNWTTTPGQFNPRHPHHR